MNICKYYMLIYVNIRQGGFIKFGIKIKFN